MSGKGPFRADHVGSLLRPESLLAAREKWKAGELDISELRALEDECIKGAVAFQESVGIGAITDGEYRRETFHADFINQIEGVDGKFEFQAAVAQGDINKTAELKAAPFIPKVVEKIKRPAGGIEVEALGEPQHDVASGP